MFSLPSRLLTVVLVYLLALCTASPLYEPETVKFKGQDIQCIPVDFPGIHSKAYCLVEGYGPDKSKAVLKFLHSSEMFSGEVENAKEFDQWLDDDGEAGIMLKDIQTNYPKPGDIKKQLHQWIAEGRREWLDDLEGVITKAKETILKEATNIANTKDKVLMDLSDNAFLSEDLSEAAFCDLDPRYVKNLKDKPRKELEKKLALEAVKENLDLTFTAEKIQIRLKRLGSRAIPCYYPAGLNLETVD